VATAVIDRPVWAPGPDDEDDVAVDVAGLARRLALSDRLRHRRFELLPLRGPAAVFTDVQGRLPGESTAPADLADLISSIASVGLLQPVLVEETAVEGGAPRLRLVAGERRLRACRYLVTVDAGNTHVAALPAIVCSGPLSEEERRVWQLVENLAREDLRPAELAAALLFERCAVAVANMLAAAIPVPVEVFELDDPVARWRLLEKARGSRREGAAPWTLVLRRLGLQMSERKARKLVEAFAAMPPELAYDMDARGIALSTRVAYLQLADSRAEAAAGIWEMVKDAGRPDLLYAAAQEQRSRPDLSAEEAVGRAREVHEAANLARSRALRRDSSATSEVADPVGVDGGLPVGDGPGADGSDREAPAAADGVVADAHVVSRAISALRELLAGLHCGLTVSRYDGGSLRLLAAELTDVLQPCPAARLSEAGG